MPIHNFGSINIDLVFRVPHIPAPGETLLSHGMTRGLGGKGANTSVALVKAGATVKHYGAIGYDGDWTVEELGDLGIDCTSVKVLDCPTGQAIIQVGDDGENVITLLRGANWAITTDAVLLMFDSTLPGEWLVLQNETAHVPYAARLANEAGLNIAYAAAPFDAEATIAVLPFVDLLALNEFEAEQLESVAESSIENLPPNMILVTHGSKGATLYQKDKPSIFQPAIPVEHVVDTTGAGDTFFGFLLGSITLGRPIEECMKLASIAAALSIMTAGAADAIPTLEQVEAYPN